jgi:hypothetical protein
MEHQRKETLMSDDVDAVRGQRRRGTVARPQVERVRGAQTVREERQTD